VKLDGVASHLAERTRPCGIISPSADIMTAFATLREEGLKSCGMYVSGRLRDVVYKLIGFHTEGMG
jgi:hypothetical protein